MNFKEYLRIGIEKITEDNKSLRKELELLKSVLKAKEVSPFRNFLINMKLVEYYFRTPSKIGRAQKRKSERKMRISRGKESKIILELSIIEIVSGENQNGNCES